MTQHEHTTTHVQSSHATDVMARIRTTQVRPLSRMAVRWKNVILWGVVVCALLCGALFVSLIVLNIADVHPMLVQRLGWGGMLMLVLRTAPWLWLLLVVVTVAMGFAVVRRTRWGYRYSIAVVVGLTFVGVMLCGIILHLTNMNQFVGRIMMAGGPARMRMIFPEQDRWQHPEQGLLGGRIVEIGDELYEDGLIVYAFDGAVWRVVVTRDTMLPRRRPLAEGMDVQMIGTALDVTTFTAEVIRPLPLSRPRNCASPMGGGACFGR